MARNCKTYVVKFIIFQTLLKWINHAKSKNNGLLIKICNIKHLLNWWLLNKILFKWYLNMKGPI